MLPALSCLTLLTDSLTPGREIKTTHYLQRDGLYRRFNNLSMIDPIVEFT